MKLKIEIRSIRVWRRKKEEKKEEKKWMNEKKKKKKDGDKGNKIKNK